jgi:signal transduction histidine kinase
LRVDPPSPQTPSSPLPEGLRKLQAITDAALAHLSLQGLFDELLGRIRDALEADTCAILLLDEASGELVARAAKGLEEEVERGVRLPVGKGFAGRVAATRRPFAIEDVDRADILNPILREKGIKSLLGAPLIADGRLLGVVHVGTLTPRRFSQDEIDLLEIVAQRAALAVDRALVYGELVRLGELQRDFVALAAHELRSPAANVYGLVTTLQERRGALPPETVAELEETLVEQADRLRRLVEQLLDLSRLDAATVGIERQRVRLRPQIEEIVESMGFAHAADVRIHVADDLEALVDPSAIERIVTNLVQNALRYGEPPVTVVAAQNDRHLRISVEDRGRGIAPEFVPYLFERFRRSGGSSAETGTGLGLAIARSYARAHGGDLVFADAKPQGARFELVLPHAPGA